MDSAESSRSWLQGSLMPSVLLMESNNSEAYEPACGNLDSASGGSLLRLLDSRRGSKRSIEFLTPSLRMSQQVRVRFCAPTEFSLAKDSRSLDNTLFQSVASINPDKRRVEVPFPWFASFRRTLLQATITWKEIAEDTGSTLFLPLVLLLAIPASEQDPVAHVTEMIDKELLSSLVPRIVVIVSTAETSSQQLETTIKLTKAAFGNDSVSLLRLDSEKSFEESFHELMTRIVMTTQRRVFSLNEVVASHKKGLGNTIRSLFGGGGGSSAAGPRHGSFREQKVYTADSLPFKVRLLADLLFWMHDYEAALTNYTYVREDYQRDEAFMHLGSVSEMIALCSFLSRGPPPSFEEGSRRVELIDRAVENYFKGVASELRPVASTLPPSQQKRTALGYRLATRACLLLLDVSPKNTFSNLKVMMKALAHEDELCAAILLEQIALLMLDTGVARRGMRRKSGFNLLHAGSLYRSLGLDRHAFRCYATVHEAFYRKGWPAAEHHLEVNLGNLSRSLGDIMSLVEYRGCSLERGYEMQNSNQHQVLLKEFVDAIENLPGRDKPLRYQIPKLVSVSMPKSEADFEVDGLDERLVTDNIWGTLEELLWGASKQKKRRSTRLEAYVHEPLFIEIVLENPLNCELALVNVALLPPSDGAAQVVLHTLENFTLSPRGRRAVRVGFVPHAEGTFKLRGLTWKLSGRSQVAFEHEFDAGPFVVDALRHAPCIHPKLASSPLGADIVAIELTNIGAADLTTDTPLMVACEELAALEWYTDDAKTEIVDEKGMVLSLRPLVRPLRPGETVVVKCRIWRLTRACYRCSIMYGPTRIARIIIPCAQSNKLDPGRVDLKGGFIATSNNDYILTVELEAKSPLKLLGVSCFAASWRASTIAQTTSGASDPDTDVSWSIAMRLDRMRLETSSFVPVHRSVESSLLGPLTPDDFQLRCYHANQIYQERLALKKEIERERAELEAKGQLPVSIQDVRRARQRGDLPPPRSDMVTSLPSGSRDAVRERSDLIHLAVDYTYEDGHVRRAFLTRVPIRPPLLSVSFSSHVAEEIRMRPSQDMCETSLTIHVANISTADKVENVCLVVGLSQATNVHDRFPRPTFWLGPTRKCWSQIRPGEEHEVNLTAVFASSGVFALSPIIVEYSSVSGSRMQAYLQDERFVAVLRDDVDDEQLFKQVERELLEA